MKQLLTCIMLLSILGVQAQRNQITTNITMPTQPMPAYITDWENLMPPVTIAAQAKPDSMKQLPPEVIESRILVTVKNKGGGKVLGSYTPFTAPMAGFNSMVRTWRGAEIEKLLGGTCTLKPGQYTLCVQFFNYEGNKPLSEERSKPFTVGASGGETPNDGRQYRGPQAISPKDSTKVPANSIAQPITFRWTPVIPPPPPQEKLIYTVRVVEISKGQTGAAAIKGNSPIFEQEVTNATQLVAVNFNLGQAVKRGATLFAWQVEAKGAEGKSYGVSEVNAFGVTGTYIVKIDSLNVICPVNSVYNFTVIVSNPNSTVALFDKLQVSVVNGATLSIPLNITGTSPAYGTTIPANGSITVNGSFSYTSSVRQVCLTGIIKEQQNPTLNEAKSFACDSLDCICKPCLANNVIAENKSIGYTNLNNQNTLIIRNTISASPTNVTKIVADLVLVRVISKSETCAQCNKKGTEQGNFIGSNQITNGNVSFWQQNGRAFRNGEHSNPNISRSVTFITNTAAGANISAGIDIGHYIGVAPPGCCGDEVEVWIRYTVWDKDCKVCDKLVKKTITRAPDCGNN